MAKLLRVLLPVAAAVVVLAGCGDDHPGEHCVRSHEESGIMPQAAVGMNGQVTTVMVPYIDVVCDEWAPNDPSTVSPEGEN
jgi:hypothetical protein